MKSVMVHQFSRVPHANIPRSVFDRTHGYKTTFDAGYLIPIMLDEYVPGDTFSVDGTYFARLATPIYPLMDNLRLSVFFFSVPYRLVWDNFKRFMGERIDPDDSISYTFPQIVFGAGGCTIGSLGDYFGLPIGIANMEVNALPFRAYNYIWDTWFRDQDIQDSVPVDTGDADSAIADYVLLRRCKGHDYFTSARPDPQKGATAVLPLGTEAPVKGFGKYTTAFAGSAGLAYESDGTRPTYADYQTIDDAGGETTFRVERKPGYDYPYVRADLTNAVAASVNDLREAIAIQHLLERDQRSGTRYPEIIMAHFGVDDPQSRVLQRPELLGMSSAPASIIPVANTSATATEKQGSLSGFGVISAFGGFTKSFTEHGLILGLACLSGDVTYQQGLDRIWTKSDRYDMYWPEFANLGEQAVLTKEIYADGSADDSLVFGYQERYAEYKYARSMITGKLRSVDAGSLDSWHLSQDLANHPTLSDTFIVENPPMSRVIAVSTEPHAILDCYFKVHCARPMPVYSVPGLNRL